jgi:hypothetical protein
MIQKSLSQILRDKFGVSEEELLEANDIGKEKGGRTGEILLQKKIISEKQLLEALSVQYDIPFWPDLPLNNIGNSFTQRVPIQFLKNTQWFPWSLIIILRFRFPFRSHPLKKRKGVTPPDAPSPYMILLSLNPSTIW